MMIILVANTKAGCGKTTVFTHLAPGLPFNACRSSTSPAKRAEQLRGDWAALLNHTGGAGEVR